MPRRNTREETDRLIALAKRVQSNFTAGDWAAYGLTSGQLDIINGHGRLLRSLDWGDDDYGGNVLQVITLMQNADVSTINDLEHYVNQTYPPDSEYVSETPAIMGRTITFSPTTFAIPEGAIDNDLVSVMMPFEAGFNDVYTAIKSACEECRFECKRADNVWNHATVIQDIFELIFRSRIVIVDFTGTNPNVMYETGIAHTLGRLVIPIAQSNDVPFNMQHHRVLKYFPNSQGLTALQTALSDKLATCR